MDRKEKFRIICAFGCGISTFLITCFLSIIVIRTTLGNTAYAIRAPLLIPLCLIAAFFTFRIFTSSDRYSENDLTEEEELEPEDISSEPMAHDASYPQLDESVYPELFEHKQEQEQTVSFSRPDIKKILLEQGKPLEEAEAPATEEEDDLRNFLFTAQEKSYSTDSLYKDIPNELPEDYIPYEYDETEEDDVEEEESYEYSPAHRVALRVICALIASVLAVVLPMNCATVYSSDSVTSRRLFSQKEYHLTDAEYYTVGVALSGDVSMKLHFDDGKEFDLIIPGAVIKSDSFKNNFSSSYGYAAFCNRLLLRSEVEKRFDDLTSLSISSALSASDLAYIAEITETEINN